MKASTQFFAHNETISGNEAIMAEACWICRRIAKPVVFDRFHFKLILPEPPLRMSKLTVT